MLIKTTPCLETVEPFLFVPHEKAVYANKLHILGIAFDGTTSFRPGSRFGPQAIRATAKNFEDYSPYFDKDIDHQRVVDIGNLPFYPSRQDELHRCFDEVFHEVALAKDNVRLLTFGGEHSVAYMPIKHYLQHYPELVLLHLDAHADLRDGYLADKFSHASIIRRVLDHFGPGHQLMQYGIRSGTKAEFQWMREHHTLRTSLQQLCDDLANLPDNRPIYLTLDLDFFDPAYLPGTGTPEAGGEDFHHFMKILKILSHKRLVGADVVELAPTIDPTGNSACFAAKIARELAVLLMPS